MKSNFGYYFCFNRFVQAFDVRFRPETAIDSDEYEEDYDNVDSVSDYPSDWESESSGTSFLSPYINLGSVPTTNFLGNETTGRMLSFPNWIQVGQGSLLRITDFSHITK